MLRRLAAVIILAMVIAACGESASDVVDSTSSSSSGMATTPTQQIVVEPTTAASASATEVTPTNSSAATPTESSVATPTTPATATVPPSPTSTPSPQTQAVTVESYGFGQPDDSRTVGWAFIVSNPNATLAIEDSQYQVAIKDDAGTVLVADSGYLNLLMPGERTAVAGTSYLPEGARASTITVAFNEGDTESLETTETFTSSNVSYFPDEYFPQVTGVIANPYNRDLEDIYVSAVAYDASGNIIGGGFTFVNLIPAAGQTGVTVSITTEGEPASVEVYGAVSSLTQLAASTGTAPESPLVLQAYGFGQSESTSQVGWGFVVENQNMGQEIARTKYRVTAYDSAGIVLGTDEGYIEFLAPGETLGYGGNLFVPEATTATSIDVQVLAGDASTSDAVSPLTGGSATYIADQFFPKATGSVTNSTDSTLEDIRVSAIAYDASGAITGGGFTFLDFVPAQSEAAAEVSVYSTGEPASVVLFPAITSLTR